MSSSWLKVSERIARLLLNQLAAKLASHRSTADTFQD